MFGKKFFKVQSTRDWYMILGMCGTIFGATYLMPIFYRAFCERTGYTGVGLKRKDFDYSKMHDPKKIHRKFTLNFQGMCEPELGWSFFPLQDSVTLNAGETVLAFFRAFNENPTPVIGISAYVVQPDEAVQYFNKIQCFCFDEQMLNPSEEVDLPLFFYLDPKICDDPLLSEVREITLMYTFYKAQDQTLAELLKNHPNSPLNRPLVKNPLIIENE
jgi:cytochrome c oxidase assembly protein subunit 11